MLATVSTPFATSALVSMGVMQGEESPELPKPVESPHTTSGGLAVSGDVFTSVKDFALQDAKGYRVLEVGKLHARVNVDAMREQRLHLPEGEAEHVKVLLRRGKGGRVSLAETVGKDDPDESSKGGMRLDIGPLQTKDVRVDVAMGGAPVAIQLRRATLRVERHRLDRPPRLFLSDIEGRLVSPSPLREPIEIHDGVGVVDLDEGPLVDMRVRVCIARGELRVRVVVPTRQPDITKLVVDGQGFMGHLASGVLGLVDHFKDSLQVEHGAVEVPGQRECERD